VLLASLLAFANGLLKWVAKKEAANYFEMVMTYWLQIGSSLAIYGFIFFYYIQVLRRHDIAVLYSSYVGLSILMVFLMGMFFFGEPLTSGQMIGVGLIILGILCIGFL
jgi:small multidrug resistance pump